MGKKGPCGIHNRPFHKTVVRSRCLAEEIISHFRAEHKCLDFVFLCSDSSSAASAQNHTETSVLREFKFSNTNFSRVSKHKLKLV